jgi:hypothetical protein
MVSVTAMTLASCGGGSGGAALPTGTSPPDIDPVYDDPKIIALERFQDGNQLVLFSSTDRTQTYLGWCRGLNWLPRWASSKALIWHHLWRPGWAGALPIS